MLYIKPNLRSYSNTKRRIDRTLIDKLINIPIKGPTTTPNKNGTITSIILTTTVTSRLTSITKEILMIIPIDSPNLTSTQELTITVHKGCIKTVIGNSVEIETNTTTLITTRINSVLKVFVNQLKQII